ncbi:hypothetical protein Dimus_021620 [Dionaea muscipula]
MALAAGCLMPGFRFHPTDEELVMYYLKRKVMGKPLHAEVISELDIYKFEPSDLPDKACLKSRDLNWYFFCPRGNKYANGGRVNRATEFGFWKATGKDRSVCHNNRTVGKIKTLVFHRGKPPKGDRTDWVLHEYRLDDDTLAAAGVIQDFYVICKIFHKSGLGPKNGEQYGAPFVEEEWENDDDEIGCASTPPSPVKCDFASNIGTSSAPARQQYGLAANDDTSIVVSSSEVVVVSSMDQGNHQYHHPAVSDAGGGGLEQQASSNLAIGGIDELDRILAMFDDNDDVSRTNEEEESTELLPPAAEVGSIDVFAQLEDLGDWRWLDENLRALPSPSPWENNYLDEHQFLELNDLV